MHRKNQVRRSRAIISEKESQTGMTSALKKEEEKMNGKEINTKRIHEGFENR